MVSKVLRGIILNLDKKKTIKLKHNSDFVFVYKNKKFKKLSCSYTIILGLNLT